MQLKKIGIKVLDLETGILSIYSSIKEAAEFIGCRSDMISRYFTRNTQKPYLTDISLQN